MNRHSSGRRWSLVAAVSVVLAGCLVLGVWLGTPWWTGRPWDGKLTDRERRVSIVIPDGWVDVTHDEAGRVVTSDASGDEIDPYRLPDLAAISGESDTARFG
ncbi:MAG TPA: hypothetical protein VF635_16180, partial [Propionibacteriaceae bacterium]